MSDKLQFVDDPRITRRCFQDSDREYGQLKRQTVVVGHQIAETKWITTKMFWG